MGQYYKPAFLAENKRTVKAWVFSHDYQSGLKLMEHSWMKNDFVGAVESCLRATPQRIVWAGDYADECKGLKTNVYDRCKEKTQSKPASIVLSLKEYPYLVNHSKKEYIDKRKTPSNDGWRIHPLPLMTCEGNGRGGGDFRGNNDLVGTWARDLISVESKAPKGYTKIDFDLTEG